MGERNVGSASEAIRIETTDDGGESSDDRWNRPWLLGITPFASTKQSLLLELAAESKITSACIQAPEISPQRLMFISSELTRTSPRVIGVNSEL